MREGGRPMLGPGCKIMIIHFRVVVSTTLWRFHFIPGEPLLQARQEVHVLLGCGLTVRPCHGALAMPTAGTQIDAANKSTEIENFGGRNQNVSDGRYECSCNQVH